MASPTVPQGKQTEADVLCLRANVWQNRPLLREIYRRYFAEMVANFAVAASGSHAKQTAGPAGKETGLYYGSILEIGGGSGNFKEYFHAAHSGQGKLMATDVVPTPHCDLAADAMALPFRDESFDNIVMQDVLHHIPFPLRFFSEAGRVLRPGGRIVMTEPYISPASRLVFAMSHPEPVVPSAGVFGETPEKDPSPLKGEGAFASNQATPTILFFRDRMRFERRFPALRIVARHRRSYFVYPLSGGFSGPKMVPRFLEPAAWAMEMVLSPFARLLAYRLVVVIEKTPGSSGGR